MEAATSGTNDECETYAQALKLQKIWDICLHSFITHRHCDFDDVEVLGSGYWYRMLILWSC